MNLLEKSKTLKSSQMIVMSGVVRCSWPHRWSLLNAREYVLVMSAAALNHRGRSIQGSTKPNAKSLRALSIISRSTVDFCQLGRAEIKILR